MYVCVYTHIHNTHIYIYTPHAPRASCRRKWSHTHTHTKKKIRHTHLGPHADVNGHADFGRHVLLCACINVCHLVSSPGSFEHRQTRAPIHANTRAHAHEHAHAHADSHALTTATASEVQTRQRMFFRGGEGTPADRRSRRPVG